MKLTVNQKFSLSVLSEELSLPKYSSKVNISTMNSLLLMGLVKLTRYANGEFWELTDLGSETINKLKLC
jgi:hypothetical protein